MKTGQDLLEKYLLRTGQKMFWALWGERGMRHSIASGMPRDKATLDLIQSHKHIHKDFAILDDFD